jgi:hypothetical protein
MCEQAQIPMQPVPHKAPLSEAQAALEESLRFDAPEAASIAEARGLLQQAAPQAAKR